MRLLPRTAFILLATAFLTAPAYADAAIQVKLWENGMWTTIEFK